MKRSHFFIISLICLVLFMILSVIRAFSIAGVGSSSSKIERYVEAETEAPTTQPAKTYTVYITRTGSCYHRSGCQYLRQSKIPIDKSEAIKAGYSKCSKCHP